jgi:uncharacterized lipoprotein YddW (UPF0748 family)
MHAKWTVSLFFVCVLLLFIATTPNDTRLAKNEYPALTYNAEPGMVRGVWVASVFNLDFPSSPGLKPSQLESEIQEIVTRCFEWGITDIFLQVRPTGDALYPSDYYPWSGWLTGSQGIPPRDGFDPLNVWINESHNNGLRLHAWINPFRLTMGPGCRSLLAQMHPEWVVENGQLYLDPGNPNARNYIVRAVEELLDNYTVDGLHFDDYFYPGRDFNDEQTFLRYGNGMTLDAWRLQNINELIMTCGQAARVRGVTFGVSPSGIWANNSTTPSGSATSGRESLTAEYADTVYWAQNGWVDYLAPQIYWEAGHERADFNTLVDWWVETLDGTGVDLYIGLAVYKQVDEAFGPAWHDGLEIDRQTERLYATPGIGGYIFFRYGNMDTWKTMRDANR